MSILAQHGYGKSDKIEEGIRNEHINGVILSPRDEQPGNMSQYINDLRDEFTDSILILIDPQFYLATIDPVQDGNLPGYPYYRQGLVFSDFIDISDIRQYARDTINFQLAHNIDRIISPSIMLYDFSDRWSHISLLMARESINYCDSLENSIPLLISLIIDENAFRNKKGLFELLDLISLWPVDGFYLVINRNDNAYPAAYDPTSLSNILYLINVLGNIHGHEIICGYSDLDGLLFHTVGAFATATGWYSKLRQFSYTRFQPASGGRRARSRYSALPLLNSILVQPELETAFRLGLIDDILSNTRYDEEMSRTNPGNVTWPDSISCLHNWEVLSGLARDLTAGGSVEENIDISIAIISDARELYNDIMSRGVPFEIYTGPRNLDIWLRAISLFREEIGL